MPTLSSDAWMASPVATSFGRSPRTAMLVAKPFGWPHAVSASLALVDVAAVVRAGLPGHGLLVTQDVRRQRGRGDLATDLTTPGGLRGHPVDGVLDGLAALDVVERRHLGGEHRVAQEAGDRVVSVLLEVLAAEDLRPGLRPARRCRRGRASSAPDSSRLSMSFASTFSVDLDLVDELLAQRVGLGVPLVVLDQGELLADLVALELVRARRERVLLVLQAGVLGLRAPGPSAGSSPGSRTRRTAASA